MFADLAMSTWDYFIRGVKRTILTIVLVIAAVYALDFAVAHLHIPPSRELMGSVEVRRYYAVRMKSGKTEFMFDDEPATENCVNALFPQLGCDPCWYVRRYPQKRVDIK